MMIRGFTILIVLFLACGYALAQNNDNSKGPSSLDPNTSKVYSPKASKKKKSTTTYDARDKYFDRMEMVSKKRRKNENMESKDQYSNFQYFGHKKPPKRRSPEKMKYCKICGIRH